MEISERELNYNRIAKAIAYIQENYKQQPSLEKIAKHVHLSPFHFQRLFQEWAGITPKKFLQYISLHHAKQILKNSNSINLTTYETGLSSTSRLHELFVKIEGMTPAEYKNEGKNLSIEFSTSISPFGKICIASTAKGICHISFIESEEDALKNIKRTFAKATIEHKTAPIHLDVVRFFNESFVPKQKLHLHLKGSIFQLKVWEALLAIPAGKLNTYGNIAQNIGNPNSSRAVGTAIGANPVAFLIPCHRVIQTSGQLGGYMWGLVRKTAIIGWEFGHVLKDQDNETF